MDTSKEIIQQATRSFYIEIKEMLHSLGRREEHLSTDTPVNQTNYNTIFDRFPDTIAIDDMETLLEEYERKYGDIRMWWYRD